ncbi:Lrp/AsnC ligand binding domain-containing protein [Actinokineospora sp. NBRC 105648]|uniref:Lrp/AsnC family transcriptional regulator n=1 Tax=Actinokineospora sp. NBRC 105648 TaxID=3032206 RepID=UPI0024A472EB|nr:Lrp/AsnC ligand binding domain-containing protein [Actinokineospora sp. NBRC 105648]GLZ38031.1 hypothetical protein Acsp05_16550 [Actinokineospora sp. NBRC 105648]
MRAFIRLDVDTADLDAMFAGLEEIPEVLRAWTSTGQGDVLCEVATRDNERVESLVHRLVALPGVTRTRTEIALRQQLAPRVLPLLDLVDAEDIDAEDTPTDPAARR